VFNLVRDHIGNMRFSDAAMVLTAHLGLALGTEID
jgi:hypothetical protein